MNYLLKYRFVQYSLTFVLLLVTQIIWAQDNSTTTSSTHTTTTTETWYVPIWAWVAGGAVLLVIIIALVSRSGRTDKVIIKSD